MPDIEFRDILLMLSTLLSPLLAVQVTQLLNRRRHVRDEQLWIFRTLMATRASNLDASHVQALNSIDVIFNGRSARQEAIRRQWKQYLDHLNDKNYPKEHWESRRKELLVELLDTMGTHLGFDFDKTHLKNQSYYPQGYGDLEAEQAALRRALVEILAAKRPLQVSIVETSTEIAMESATTEPRATSAPR